MKRSSGQMGICLAIGALAACSASHLGSTDSSAPDSGTDSSAPAPGCPTAQGPIDAKITEADRMRFEATSEPVDVIIMVVGGAQVGPLPECPADRTQPCPERDSIQSRMEAENLASQRCVRDLIANIGGAAEPTTFTIINAFSATLTWDQIQVVTGHPHVLSISASYTDTPPP